MTKKGASKIIYFGHFGKIKLEEEDPAWKRRSCVDEKMLRGRDNPAWSFFLRGRKLRLSCADEEKLEKEDSAGTSTQEDMLRHGTFLRAQEDCGPAGVEETR